MTTYFKSSQVHVFPCAYRGTSATSTIDPEARLNTEKNLTNTGNNLKGTYLIERKYTQDSVDLLRVVIGGYYFEINLAASGGIGWSDLQNNYLAIRTIETPLVTDGTNNTTLLVAWETSQAGYLDNSEGNFLGLAIVDGTTIPQKATAYIKVADSNGNILNDAYLPDISSSTGSKSLASSGCTATGDHAVSLGLGLAGATTPVDGQTIVGKYNADANGKLFVVGNGSARNTSSNAFTVNTDGDAAITRNATIGGTLSVAGTPTFTDNFTVGTNKFNVAATSGDTTVAGTLGVAGAATFNGGATTSSLTVSGDANVARKIQCANLEAGQKVKCDDLAVGQIEGIDTEDITLCKTLLPQNSSTVNLGSDSYLFNNVYSKKLYLVDPIAHGTSQALVIPPTFAISYNSGWNISTNVLTSFLTGGTLTIGRGGRATATFGVFDVTFDRKIIAEKGIQVDGVTSSDVLQSNVDIKIASGKHLDLSGSSTGSIKLKGETGTESKSYTVVGNGIYNITFKSNLESAPNRTYSVTMALISPSSSSLLDSTIYSSEIYRQELYEWRIMAVHGSNGWTLTFTSGYWTANCNWFVTKIADVA